jgi:hypothetical protein
MKKSILGLVIMIMAGLSSAFAEKGIEVNPAVIASFNKDFGNVKTVSWEKQKDYDKATFSMNDQVLFAYYKEDGELLAIVRNMLSNQLPINLMTDLKNNFLGYWVSDLFEMASGNKTSYFITLENANETLILESDDYDQWTIYDKTRKGVI